MISIKYRLRSFWEAIRYGVPRFIKNVWIFRKALWEFNWWDSHGLFVFNRIGLTVMADNTEAKGIEVVASRMMKVKRMRRAAELYKNFIENNFIDQAEAELGELVMHPFEFKQLEDRPNLYELVNKETPKEKTHNQRVFKRAREIEEEQWSELHKILKGPDYSKFKPSKMEWDDFYDGSDMRSWWD